MLQATTNIPPSLTSEDVTIIRDVLFTLSTNDLVDTHRSVFNGSPAPSDDNVSGYISAHTAQVVENVVLVGILPVLVLCGVITNVINMAVFSRLGLSDRVNTCLFSLAVSDSGYLLSLYASRVYSVVKLVDSASGQYWKARSLALIGLYQGFLNTTNVLTLLVAMDRCWCVVRPLHAKTLLSARRTAVLVVLVFTVCLCCCGLACFKYDVISYVDPVTNVTTHRSSLTPFYRRHRDAIDAVYQYTLNVTVPTLSLIGVMICTIVIAAQMRRTIAWRENSAQMAFGRAATSTERREAALTRMLVVVCVTFTLCTIPTVTFSFVRTLVPGFLPSGRYTNAFYVSNGLMHMMSSFNCSINFVIYYVMGSRFKATLRLLVRSCCRSQDRPERGSGISMETIFTSASCASISTMKDSVQIDYVRT